MEDQRLDVGVLEQVGELAIEIAVVHVDRNAADLDRREVRLAVFGRVVQVHPHLAVGAESRVEQRLREPRRALLVAAPVDPAFSLDDGGRVGHRVGDRLPDGAEMRLHADQITAITDEPWPNRPWFAVMPAFAFAT